MDRKSIFFLLIWLATVVAEEDWTKECNKCKCMWVSGKKTADCTFQNFDKIPTDMSKSIREIDFSNNPLYRLPREVFLNAKLRDIHKLKFINCSISNFENLAFRGLLLLIELDLSRNYIAKLERSVFRDNGKLRILTLSYNRIKVIEEGLFFNMTFLQKLSLDHNEIETITEKTFRLLPALHHINLGHNRIRQISFNITSLLPKLNSLQIEENPWICDCKLKEFRRNTIERNLVTTPTTCEEPPRLRGRTWYEEIDFACSPEIIDPLPSTQIEAKSYNITLPCKVSGDPQPDVDWVINGRIIERDPRQNKQKFITFKSKAGLYTWNNLTITNVNYRDRGEYKCIAKNPGGEDESNVTLVVDLSTIGTGGANLPLDASVPWIIGLSALLIICCIFIIVYVCYWRCCRRSTHGMASKRHHDPHESSDEYISMRGPPDMKKVLITEVNPVTKPPRAVMPSSNHSGGTELSDTQKNLLETESFYECDDELRSVDYEQPLLRKSMMMNVDFRFSQPYPPDLLSFPARTTQVSPAGSCASTVPDTTRLPPHHGPQSPITSPMFDMSLYRTLPYSRSQSPFVPTRIPKQGQGYVTIPRRPRQQSWSSEPPNSTTMPPEPAEPLYDNLGLRTTINGSSALSLNKLAEATTPRSNRMFPISPTSCDPIAENESLANTTPLSASTLPRNLNSQKLTPSRTNWAKPKPVAQPPPLQSPERRNSSASLPSPGGDGNIPKPTKIPPRPPPKPKKRVSTGPLFEDEGEDGTEV